MRVLVDPCGPAAVNVVQNLRMCAPMPIIVISAIDGLDGERQRAALLDAGADDCLSKPFGVDELLARLRAVLRRATHHNDPAPVTTPDFRIDLSAMRCFRPDGSEVRLTAKEWGMIEVLVRHPGRVVRQGEILDRVWGPKGSRKTDYLRVYMASIRHKLEPDPAHPRYFITAPGIGLLFVPEGEPATSSTAKDPRVHPSKR
jgi:two-component system KDP operon response regulator KdpE